MRSCEEFMLRVPHWPESGFSDLERPASACLREDRACSGGTHPVVLSVSPRPCHLRCNFGCQEKQGLTEKLASDSTIGGLWDTPATPLT